MTTVKQILFMLANRLPVVGNHHHHQQEVKRPWPCQVKIHCRTFSPTYKRFNSVYLSPLWRSCGQITKMDSKQNQTRRRINVSKSLFDCSRGRLTKVGAKDHSGRFPSRAKKGKLLMGNFVKPYLLLYTLQYSVWLLAASTFIENTILRLCGLKCFVKDSSDTSLKNGVPPLRLEKS